MTLYSEPDSPFSAAVRLAIYAKGLDIAVVPPPGGLLSTDFHAINPVGTIPCLMLANGAPLSESAAILEYFEDAFPALPLLPGSAEQRAGMRLLARIADLNVMTPLVRLARRPDEGEIATATWLTRLVRGLASLNRLVAGVGAPGAAGLTLADCFLAPALFILPAAIRGRVSTALLDAYPDLRDHHRRLSGNPHVLAVHGELATRWH